jgi:transposase
LAWAAQAVGQSLPDGPLHHAIWTDLEELYQHFQQRISAVEQALATELVHTPYVRLLAIPGINVVLAAELAGELGPITRYANANAITGRCGLYPSRSQSDQMDHDSGPIVRQSNRRLRAALMRIADSLAFHCAYYRGQAGADEARGIDKRAARVKIAKRFSRLAFACVAGNEPLKHPFYQKPGSILERLRAFHHQHKTRLDRLLADLQAAVSQLPRHTCRREAEIVAEVLERQTHRHRGGVAIGELLPAVIARLKIRATPVHEDRGRS